MLMEGFVENESREINHHRDPKALMVFYQQFPFWRTFFEQLGFTVVISKESDKSLVTSQSKQ
jgi:predicted nucleotide-binding protein (sugar kinase/HSP70/actin superfamily)